MSAGWKVPDGAFTLGIEADDETAAGHADSGAVSLAAVNYILTVGRRSS